jgi:hypothetical protein
MKTPTHIPPLIEKAAVPTWQQRRCDMLETTTIRRVVLIAAAAVEQAVLREVERLGFLAYSSVRCAGRGSPDTVHDVFSESSHVRIEALGSDDLAHQLLQYVDDSNLSRFSVVCFMDSVQVSASAALA